MPWECPARCGAFSPRFGVAGEPHSPDCSYVRNMSDEEKIARMENFLKHVDAYATLLEEMAVRNLPFYKRIYKRIGVALGRFFRR